MQAVAELLQQGKLEAAQDDLLRLPRGQRTQGVAVGPVEGRVRIFPRQQAHQQLVGVVGAQQRLTAEQRLATLPFGADEGLHLATAAPVDQERLEGHQHAASCAHRPPRALGHQAQPAMVAAEDLDDQAGLAVRVAVQHEARLLVDALLGAHGSRRQVATLVAQALEGALVVGPAALDLDPGFETLESKSFSSSRRASVAMRLRRSPPLPITIALWASRLTMIAALMRAQARLGLELLDLDGHAVGQLLAELAEQLLAEELGGQEALAAVGDVVRRRDRLALGQVGLGGLQELGGIVALLARTPGRSRRRGNTALIFWRKGSILALSSSDVRVLLTTRITLAPSGSSLTTCSSAWAVAAALDHEEHQVDIGEHLGDGAVDRPG